MGWQAKKHAMLGLGDIVIPGIFVALLRRFDCRVLEQGANKKKQLEGKKGRWYFQTTMVAYAAGLTLTIFIMHVFKAAQPALLYLVPACVGVPIALATIRGELSDLWNYSEEHLVKKDDKETAKDAVAHKKTN
uniref:Uncharacterized protein n=1 Tax=Plectus sambesii TaxID=2011161 RepID=A0A914UW50_9BILA